MREVKPAANTRDDQIHLLHASESETDRKGLLSKSPQAAVLLVALRAVWIGEERRGEISYFEQNTETRTRLLDWPM